MHSASGTSSWTHPPGCFGGNVRACALWPPLPPPVRGSAEKRRKPGICPRLARGLRGEMERGEAGARRQRATGKKDTYGIRSRDEGRTSGRRRGGAGLRLSPRNGRTRTHALAALRGGPETIAEDLAARSPFAHPLLQAFFVPLLPPSLPGGACCATAGSRAPESAGREVDLQLRQLHRVAQCHVILSIRHSIK